MNIIWSDLAKDDIREIYNYYKVTASKRVAESIVENILLATKKLAKHKEIGKIEENKSVEGRGYRFLVSGVYKIVYRCVDSKTILIASVFDCRQNPDKLIIPSYKILT